MSSSSNALLFLRWNIEHRARIVSEERERQWGEKCCENNEENVKSIQTKDWKINHRNFRKRMMKKALMESPLKLGLLLFFSRFQSLSCADIAWRQTMTISRRFRPSSSTVLFYHSSLFLNPIASRSILTISGIHSYAVSSSSSRLESEREVFGSRWKQRRENRRREKES